MPRKKKQPAKSSGDSPIDKERAIQIAVTHAISELNKRGLKPLTAAFAVKGEHDVAIMDLNGSVPEPHAVQHVIDAGFKAGAQFVIFTIASPSLQEENNTIMIAAYDKKHTRDLRISPFKIKDGKIIPLSKAEKGFHIFMED